MATCTISFQGEALGKCNHLDAIIPDHMAGPFPVLYLLHGLSDNQTIWNRHVPLADLARDLPLIVVMPDGGKSFYCNNPAPGGDRYEDHVIEDVVGFVDGVFPSIGSRESRALAGNSMGGYGSVMLALRHPEMFCAAVSHSGALYFAHAERPMGHGYASELMAALPQGEYDVFKLAEQLAGSRDIPALRLDCGVEDGLLDSNREFHAHLDALGIAHEYAEHPGGHTWQYWRDHVGETLDFVMRHLAAG
jgi:S-formylglutathione hydrolase FrmB